MTKKENVLVLYTGGTIGMLHKNENPSSPLVPAGWEHIKKHLSEIEECPFGVTVKEMDYIDSSDMNPDYWIRIAIKVRDEYNKYDGFVILHGTDTMAYTASALSFLLENLDKPVVFTGSQLPLSKPNSDAKPNFMNALRVAASNGLPIIPEVCILFDQVLLRGNRSRKINTSDFAGFDSPNYRKLATIGGQIEVDTRFIRKQAQEDFFIHESFDTNVIIVDIFPGMNIKIINDIVSINRVKGIILKTYGVGNAPTDSGFLNVIKEATKRGIIVVNITQCMYGAVEMGLYDASAELLKAGVISGADMTPEAALVKLMFLLGQGYDAVKIKEGMQRDLRGEINIGYIKDL